MYSGYRRGNAGQFGSWWNSVDDLKGDVAGIVDWFGPFAGKVSNVAGAVQTGVIKTQAAVAGNQIPAPILYGGLAVLAYLVLKPSRK